MSYEAYIMLFVESNVVRILQGLWKAELVNINQMLKAKAETNYKERKYSAYGH